MLKGLMLERKNGPLDTTIRLPMENAFLLCVDRRRSESFCEGRIVSTHAQRAILEIPVPCLAIWETFGSRLCHEERVPGGILCACVIRRTVDGKNFARQTYCSHRQPDFSRHFSSCSVSLVVV